MVFDRAADVSQKAGDELEGHERFLRHLEFTGDVKARRGSESGPVVKLRMAHQDDRAESELLGLFEAGARQRRADPLR
ncbi:MAG TPA: hypothetical protein VEX43_16380 [Chthoniobacterales bacterium]|nr:hypothetical protein [Chthoniobacterales bacterium]